MMNIPDESHPIPGTPWCLDHAKQPQSLPHLWASQHTDGMKYGDHPHIGPTFAGSLPGESLGGCVLRQLLMSDFEGLMRSSLAFKASWNKTEPPMAL